MALTDAQRRANGQSRLVVWLPEEYTRKLDELCHESGYSRAEEIMGMIDAGLDDVAALRTKRERKVRRNLRAPAGG